MAPFAVGVGFAPLRGPNGSFESTGSNRAVHTGFIPQRRSSSRTSGAVVTNS